MPVVTVNKDLPPTLQALVRAKWDYLQARDRLLIAQRDERRASQALATAQSAHERAAPMRG